MPEPLRLPEKEAVVVGYVSDFYELLRAIDETMPQDAVLVLEGNPTPDVADFLERRQTSEQPSIEPNTLWPKPRYFQLGGALRQRD